MAEGEDEGSAGARRRADLASADFIDTVAHELRTPVTTLKGLGQLLDDRWEQLDEAQRRDSVRAMRRQADRLSALVSGLLDLSRIESGTLDIEMVPVDLAHVVVRVIDAVDIPSDHHVDVDVPPGTIVLADSTYVDLIVSNLLINALRHGGDHIEVRSERRGDMMSLVVSDDGPGIADGQLGGLFDRFTRGRDSGGSGLGLALTHAVVELFDGEIGYGTRPSGGAEFTVSLPMPPAPT